MYLRFLISVKSESTSVEEVSKMILALKSLNSTMSYREFISYFNLSYGGSVMVSSLFCSVALFGKYNDFRDSFLLWLSTDKTVCHTQYILLPLPTYWPAPVPLHLCHCVPFLIYSDAQIRCRYVTNILKMIVKHVTYVLVYIISAFTKSVTCLDINRCVFLAHH